MEDKIIVAVCGRICTFYRNRNEKDLAWKKVSEYKLANAGKLSVFATEFCSNTKFSRVQLHTNSAIYSLHSQLV